MSRWCQQKFIRNETLGTPHKVSTNCDSIANRSQRLMIRLGPYLEAKRARRGEGAMLVCWCWWRIYECYFWLGPTNYMKRRSEGESPSKSELTASQQTNMWVAIWRLCHNFKTPWYYRFLTPTMPLRKQTRTASLLIQAPEWKSHHEGTKSFPGILPVTEESDQQQNLGLRHVQFSQEVVLHEPVLSPSGTSSFSDTWYTKQELRSMKQQALIDLAIILKRELDFSFFPRLPAPEPNENNKSQLPCLRGLEKRRPFAYKRHQANKRLVRQTVLHEQEFQREFGSQDERYLADLYSMVTGRSAYDARELARKDEIDARSYSSGNPWNKTS